jgi:Rieske Fe-S protein
MESLEARNGAKSNGMETETLSRRKLLGWLVGIINFSVAAAIIGPTLGFIGAPLKSKKKAGIWVPVLEEAELKDGQTKAVTYQLDVKDGYMVTQRRYSVYLYRRGNRVVAYDPSCPHLGCHVEFKERKRRYVCPCHGGVFDEEGNRVSGPPPRGLTKIATKVEHGKIWVYRA